MTIIRNRNTTQLERDIQGIADFAQARLDTINSRNDTLAGIKEYWLGQICAVNQVFEILERDVERPLADVLATLDR